MQEVTGSIPVISTRKKKHHTEMCGAFLVSAGLNSLSHGLRRDSSLEDGALGIAMMFPAEVQSLRTRQLRPLRRSRARFPFLSPAVTSSPGAGEVFPQGGSQAVKPIAKALGVMRKLPAVLLALPLGELDLRSKD